ncbi:hypothetical protein NC651_031126 [Populus alba x Populus x berolinensis]|nr:hypothetical protein NC651_031126 [Populus alba x Populus x berolinensis]
MKLSELQFSDCPIKPNMKMWILVAAWIWSMATSYQVTEINDESYARQQDKIQMYASGDGGLDTPLSWSVAGMRNQCSEAYNYMAKLIHQEMKLLQ